MGMRLSYIRLQNFRSHEFFDSGELQRFNILVGPNGAGKTNIIEAIQLVTSLESFRTSKWNEMVRWGCEKADIRAALEGGGRKLDIDLYIKDARRRYQLNGKGRTTNDLRGELPSVIFNPDDLDIVKGSAERRRNGLDAIGMQLSGTYHDLKAELSKALRQKNALLQAEQRPDELLISAWNENVAKIAAHLVKHRLNLFNRFAGELRQVYAELDFANDFEIFYLPTWSHDEKGIRESTYTEDELYQLILAQMQGHIEAELASGRCLVGPQRDDLLFNLNAHDARKYASQGQQRFIALAWKIAEMKTIEDIAGTRPLLLLDDVLSELDLAKRNVLLDYLLDNKQTFITTTDISQIDDRILRDARVFEIGR
ncbi:MAG: DNA replication/repair protein RecF [Coriobacteriales bacterium]|jgi:DNA replication and repair protein RecF